MHFWWHFAVSNGVKNCQRPSTVLIECIPQALPLADSTLYSQHVLQFNIFFIDFDFFNNLYLLFCNFLTSHLHRLLTLMSRILSMFVQFYSSFCFRPLAEEKKFFSSFSSLGTLTCIVASYCANLRTQNDDGSICFPFSEAQNVDILISHKGRK